METAGRRLELITVKSKDCADLNIENLQKVTSKCGNRKLAIYTVAGAKREGKSTLSNFFLQFLRHGENWKESQEVIASRDSAEETSRFDADHDQSAVTKGIWIWSEPFIREMKDGSEVAILLVDTQGAFDIGHPQELNPFIFGLSMSISSIMLYNIMSKIDLPKIEYLTVYAKHLYTQKAGYQTLKFVVRDFRGGIGSLEGKNYLQEELPPSSNEASVLYKLFREVNCFLMPYPEMKILVNTEKPVRVTDFGEGFMDSVQELCNEIFVKNVEVKMNKDSSEWNTTSLEEVLASLVRKFNNQGMSDVYFFDAIDKKKADAFFIICLLNFKKEVTEKIEKRLNDTKKAYVNEKHITDFANVAKIDHLNDLKLKIESMDSTQKQILEQNFHLEIDKWVRDEIVWYRSVKSSLTPSQVIKQKFDTFRRTFEENKSTQEKIIRGLEVAYVALRELLPSMLPINFGE